MDTGLVVYGVEDTMKALVTGAVETIICWEGLTHMRCVMRDRETGGIILFYINFQREILLSSSKKKKSMILDIRLIQRQVRN